MDGPPEGAPGCMIPRLNHIRRCPDARAAVCTKVEKRQRHGRLRGYTHPHAFPDLAKCDLPCSSMCEPVPNDCFDECRGEIAGCIQHVIAPGPRREAGVGSSRPQWGSDMPLRHDPVAFRKRCSDQKRLDQAPRIAAFGHVKVEPNPDAADRTSSSPPDRKRSMGRATPSSKGHS